MPCEYSSLHPIVPPPVSVDIYAYGGADTHPNFPPAALQKIYGDGKYRWDVYRNRRVLEAAGCCGSDGHCESSPIPVVQGGCQRSTASSSSIGSPQQTVSCDTPRYTVPCNYYSLPPSVWEAEKNTAAGAGDVTHMEAAAMMEASCCGSQIGNTPKSMTSFFQPFNLDTMSGEVKEYHPHLHQQQQMQHSQSFSSSSYGNVSYHQSYPVDFQHSSPLSTSDKKDVLKRFTKMLPPPVQSAILLNERKSHLSVAELFRSPIRWYTSMVEIEEFPLHNLSINSNTSGNGGKSLSLWLRDPCPEPPKGEEQTEGNMTLWLQRCNKWWEERFGENARNGGAQRGGGFGRGKGRYQSHAYHYSNNTSAKVNGNGRGPRFHGDVRMTPRTSSRHHHLQHHNHH